MIQEAHDAMEQPRDKSSQRPRRRPQTLSDIVEQDPDYQAARRFAKEFEPNQDLDYEWACEHASAEYERAADWVESLDAKADSIMNYLSAFFGLALVAFAYQAIDRHWLIGLAVVPSLVVGFCAIMEALKARSPAGLPMPPSGRRAIDYVESTDEMAQIRFCPWFWVATEAMRIVAHEKGRRINQASRLFLTALGLMGLPLVCALLIAAG